MSGKQRQKLQKEKARVAKEVVPSAVSASSNATPPPPAAPKRRIDRFVMNLPGTALEFLDTFKEAFAALASKVDQHELEKVYDMMPMVHVHCFTRELEEDRAREDIIKVRRFFRQLILEILTCGLYYHSEPKQHWGTPFMKMWSCIMCVK